MVIFLPCLINACFSIALASGLTFEGADEIVLFLLLLVVERYRIDGLVWDTNARRNLI